MGAPRRQSVALASGGYASTAAATGPLILVVAVGGPSEQATFICPPKRRMIGAGLLSAVAAITGSKGLKCGRSTPNSLERSVTFPCTVGSAFLRISV